jgi:hypothetical protein
MNKLRVYVILKLAKLASLLNCLFILSIRGASCPYLSPTNRILTRFLKKTMLPLLTTRGRHKCSPPVRPSLRAYANEIKKLIADGHLTHLSPEEGRRQLDVAILNAKKLKVRAQAKVKGYPL